MRRSPAIPLLATFGLACPAPGLAAGPDGARDRLILSLSGATITDADDGGGANIAWLHNFNSDVVVGVGAQYQTIAESHWQFGSLTASWGIGEAARRTTLFAEYNRGTGDDNSRGYTYQIATVGIVQSLNRQLSLQLEDRQIDIDTTHGNLPKLGVNYLWSPRVLTALSYSNSVSGNLGTEIVALRADVYGRRANLIIGGAGGKGSPAVFDLQTGLTQSGATLREVFLGVTKPLKRVELTLLGDYLELSDNKRFTLTLSCTVNLNARGG